MRCRVQAGHTCGVCAKSFTFTLVVAAPLTMTRYEVDGEQIIDINLFDKVLLLFSILCLRISVSPPLGPPLARSSTPLVVAVKPPIREPASDLTVPNHFVAGTNENLLPKPTVPNDPKISD